MKRLEAFEMWGSRKTLKIFWSNRATNEEVLRRIKEKKQIWKIIINRKYYMIGYMVDY